MIFGHTYIERLKDERDYDKSMREWKKWYAWYPVDIENGRTVWLDYVERRYVKPYFKWKSEYRLIFIQKRFLGEK